MVRSCPQRPPQLATHTAALRDPHKPTQSMGGQERESHPLTPPPARSTATGLTGNPSPHHLLPSFLSPAQIPRLPFHLFPLLSTAQALCTETGSSPQALAPRSHPRATSTHCSTPTSRTWESNQAGMEEEEFLRSTDALGRRGSIAGASRR